MTVRVAELAMAILMGVFSLYLMYKSAELPIGWIPDEGPGGGAWPFWLAAMMLFSCVGIIVNWVRRKGAVAVSEEPYVERGGIGARLAGQDFVQLYRCIRRATAFPDLLHALAG